MSALERGSMGVNRKYLVAVALLAVLAVVFGLAGTVIPVSEPPLSSSSSDSVTHFMNPPTYDSGWVNITTKAGQYFTLRHDLNTTDVVADIRGKQSLDPMGGALAWNKTYGGTNADYGYSVVQTGDGGYALAGWTDSFGAGGYDAWLVKTDSSGVMQWNQTYGGTGVDEPYSVVQTGDGGYALAGWTQSFGAGNSDFWLVKTDSTGNHLWNKTYGGANTDDACSVVQTGDGGYALAGYTLSFGAGSYDFWLVKTDSTGNHLWNKTYGGANIDAVWSVVQTVDGGYALAGYTNSFGAGNSDFWLVKTDSTGNHLWNKTYGGANTDVLYLGQPMALTVDGGYALAGRTDSFGAGARDFWLVKTDSSGVMQWNQTYGGTSVDEPYSVVQTGDGGYALAGWTDSFGAGSYDFWLVKVNGEMNKEHQRNLGTETGLTCTALTNTTITFYRGSGDPYWNHMQVRIWTIEEPTWMFGDINQDGIVDVQDLAILSRNYGKTFSALSLTGILAIAGIHTYKKRKEQPE